MSQPTGPTGPTGPVVPNYLVPAILSTICCCPPFGIVSIVYATQVNGHLAAGNHAAAVEASKNAKKWAWITFIVGIVSGIIGVIFEGAFMATMYQQMQKNGQLGPGGFPVVPPPPPAVPAAP